MDAEVRHLRTTTGRGSEPRRGVPVLLASEPEHCCVRHLPRVPQAFSCVSSRDVPAPHSLVARGGRSYYTASRGRFRPSPPRAPLLRPPARAERCRTQMHSHTASHTPRTRLSAPLNVQLIGFGERAPAASARVSRAVEPRTGRARRTGRGTLFIVHSPIDQLPQRLNRGPRVRGPDTGPEVSFFSRVCPGCVVATNDGDTNDLTD